MKKSTREKLYSKDFPIELRVAYYIIGLKFIAYFHENIFMKFQIFIKSGNTTGK